MEDPILLDNRNYNFTEEIVADGPGWIDRIEAALKTGAVSLPAVAALLAGAAAVRQEGSSREAS
jgi:hypothetical protein